MVTARSMFADWYREAIVSPSSEIIDVRIKTIAAISKNDSISFWLDVLKIYLGYNTSDISSYNEFISEFKKTDSTFPLQGNENLIHILAASSMCIKLDEDISLESDALALAIVTSNFFNQFNIKSKVPVSQNAFVYLLKESTRFRETDVIQDINEGEIDFTPIKVEIDTINDTFDETHVEKPFDNINETIEALVLKVNMLSKEVANHQKIHLNLSEEVNILWWVFGEQSNKLQTRFKDIGFLRTALIAPLELSELITQSPSFVTVTPILHKVLKLGHSKETKYPAVSLTEIVNSFEEPFRKSISRHENDSILSFTPCLLGLKKSLDVNQGEDWSNSFKKATHGADPNKKKSALDFTEQIFRELQFLRSYHSCF
jgi:hypothetical protein